ncbi:hypothetical protein PCE1_004671 [Barthelona sp. PCE]
MDLDMEVEMLKGIFPEVQHDDKTVTFTIAPFNGDSLTVTLVCEGEYPMVPPEITFEPRIEDEQFHTELNELTSILVGCEMLFSIFSHIQMYCQMHEHVEQVASTKKEEIEEEAEEEEVEDDTNYDQIMQQLLSKYSSGQLTIGEPFSRQSFQNYIDAKVSNLQQVYASVHAGRQTGKEWFTQKKAEDEQQQQQRK